MTDITRTRGDTYTELIAVKDTENETAINIAGCSFLLTVDPEKEPTTASNNLFQLSGVVTDAPNGIVGFSPSESQVDHVGTFYYDIQMLDTSSKKRTIASGKFILKQDITKA